MTGGRVLGTVKRRFPGPWGKATRAWMRTTRKLAPLEVPRDRVIGAVAGRRRAARFAEVERYVMFVGAQRSGHSLVGSLLNAHPDVVIGHQVDALRHVAAGFDRRQVFALLWRGEERYGRKGRVSNKGAFDYTVAGAWQGEVRRLRVIGDKRGHTSTLAIQRDPTVLDRLAAVVQVPVVLLHVQRNPYDNIATLARRIRRPLDDAADRYFAVLDVVDQLRVDPRHTLVEVRHEALIADPRAVLRTLCEAIGVEVLPQHLEASAAIVYDSPHRSRTDAAWPAGLVDDIAGRIAARPSLAGYAFDEPG